MGDCTESCCASGSQRRSVKRISVNSAEHVKMERDKAIETLRHARRELAGTMGKIDAAFKALNLPIE